MFWRLALAGVLGVLCVAQDIVTSDVVTVLQRTGIRSELIRNLISTCLPRCMPDAASLNTNYNSRQGAERVPQHTRDVDRARTMLAAGDDDRSTRSHVWHLVGPWGGTATVITIDPKQVNRLLASGPHSFLFVSEDAARNWFPLPFPHYPLVEITSLLIDEAKSGHYLVGVIGNSDGGLIETRDAGATWHVNPYFRDTAVRALSSDATNPAHLVAGSTTGVFESWNSGQGWKSISDISNPEMQGITSVAISPQSQETIYAGTTHLAWKTNNGGASWFPIDKGMIDDSDVFSIDVDPSTPERVFASACSGVYESKSGGSTWRKLNGIPAECRRTHVIRMDPRQASALYAATTCGLFKSNDAGVTWSHQWAEQVNSFTFDIASPSHLFLASNEDGILASNDGGGSFESLNRGFVARHISDVTSSGDVLYAIDSVQNFNRIFVSNDSGSTWRELKSERGLEGSHVTALAGDVHIPDVLFVADSGRLLRSIDGGTNWKAVQGLPRSVPYKPCEQTSCDESSKGAETQSVESLPRINRLLFMKNKSGRELLAATDTDVFISWDEGATWQIGIAGVSTRVFDVYVSPGTNDFMVARAENGLYTSKTGGDTWTPIGTPVPLIEINDIAVPLQYPGAPIFAATRGGMFVSIDGGNTWAVQTNGLPRSTMDSIIVDPAEPTRLYAIGIGQLYESIDCGRTWRQIGSDARNLQIRRLCRFLHASDRLIASTDNLGMVVIDFGRGRSYSR